MPQDIKGTFSPGPGGNPNAYSDTLVIHSTATVARLSLGGFPGYPGDSGDSVKTQKSLNNGRTWADQSTYSVPASDSRVLVATVSVAHGEQWRLMVVGRPTKSVDYSLSITS